MKSLKVLSLVLIATSLTSGAGYAKGISGGMAGGGVASLAAPTLPSAPKPGARIASRNVPRSATARKPATPSAMNTATKTVSRCVTGAICHRCNKPSQPGVFPWLTTSQWDAATRPLSIASRWRGFPARAGRDRMRL